MRRPNLRPQSCPPHRIILPPNWRQTLTTPTLFTSAMLPGYTSHRVQGMWHGINAGGRESPHLCPQFHLFIEQDCHVVVELRQPSSRTAGLSEYVEAVCMCKAANHSMALSLIQYHLQHPQSAPPPARNPTARYMAISPIICGRANRTHNVLLKPRLGKCPYAASRSCVVELDLKVEEGPFAIVPCAWEEGWESQYFLNVYTTAPSELHPCSDSDVPRDAVTGEVLKGDLVGFTGDDGETDFVLKDHQVLVVKHKRQLHFANFMDHATCEAAKPGNREPRTREPTNLRTYEPTNPRTHEPARTPTFSPRPRSACSVTKPSPLPAASSAAPTSK